MTLIVKTKEEFAQSIKEGVTVVDFYADWCGPCQALAPNLDTLSEQNEGKLKVIKVNVDDHPELAKEYGVRGIPALFFLKDGEVKSSATGNMSLTDLQARVESTIS